MEPTRPNLNQAIIAHFSMVSHLDINWKIVLDHVNFVSMYRLSEQEMNDIGGIESDEDIELLMDPPLIT